jgi:hypothetical protein
MLSHKVTKAFAEKVLTYFTGSYRSNLFEAIWGDNVDESVVPDIYITFKYINVIYVHLQLCFVIGIGIQISYVHCQIKW